MQLSTRARNRLELAVFALLVLLIWALVPLNA